MNEEPGMQQKGINLDPLFKPQNVAIYEAKDKLSYFFEGFEKLGFPRENLYLINRHETNINGFECYKSLQDIPAERIDLVILAVRREKLIASLKHILQEKNIRFIHFFSAGTGESDELGEKIEQEIKTILDKTDTRAIGPNCMGVYCPEGKNTYSPSFPKEAGNIGLIFHSGDLHTKMIRYGALRYDFKFSKGVSVGNCIDLQISDFLTYFNQDPSIDFICVYFEGFSKHHPHEGRVLYRALKSMKKPVLFLRGGRTERAQTAVRTHTGSLGTPQKLWNAIFEQTPAIEVSGILDDLLDNAYLFYEFFKHYGALKLEQQSQFYPKDKNALAILWSGGIGILDTDVLTELGIKLPQFKGKELEDLRKVYPLKIGSLSNPLDLPWIVATDIFINISRAAITEQIDVIIIETDSPLYWNEERFERYYQNLLEIKDYVNSLKKFLILILPQYPHPVRQSYYRRLLDDGFIVYPSIRRAGRAFLALYWFGKKATTD